MIRPTQIAPCLCGLAVSAVLVMGFPSAGWAETIDDPLGIVMSVEIAERSDPGAGEGEGQGVLPTTGGERTPLLPFAGAVAIVVGSALLVARRVSHTRGLAERDA